MGLKLKRFQNKELGGIYHEKEKAVANTFGFSEFRRLTDMELELSEEEKNTYDDFGYWCRKVNL